MTRLTLNHVWKGDLVRKSRIMSVEVSRGGADDVAEEPMTPDRLIVEVDGRRGVLLDVIRQARRRITLSLFRCNDAEILAELTAASARGVTVDVLVTSRAKGGMRSRRPARP
jgi:phosphatidylserine/phosphatidylglycerophosphate/cardiolipin synthase-like enzyme